MEYAGEKVDLLTVDEVGVRFDERGLVPAIVQQEHVCPGGERALVHAVAVRLGGLLALLLAAGWLGAPWLLEALARLDQLTPVPQDHAAATLAPPLRKEMARFTFDADAARLHDLVRGMNPWPVAFFEHDGKKIKVLSSRVAAGSAQPGTILALKPLTVACAVGALQLLQVVPEGGKPMEGSAWAAGRRFKAGDRL